MDADGWGEQPIRKTQNLNQATSRSTILQVARNILQEARKCAKDQPCVSATFGLSLFKMAAVKAARFARFWQESAQKGQLIFQFGVKTAACTQIRCDRDANARKTEQCGPSRPLC